MGAPYEFTMKSLFVLLCLLGAVAASFSNILNVTCTNEGRPGNFYDLSFPLLNGTNVSFSEYKGKVVLISNMASF